MSHVQEGDERTEGRLRSHSSSLTVVTSQPACYQKVSGSIGRSPSVYECMSCCKSLNAVNVFQALRWSDWCFQSDWWPWAPPCFTLSRLQRYSRCVYHHRHSRMFIKWARSVLLVIWIRSQCLFPRAKLKTSLKSHCFQEVVTLKKKCRRRFSSASFTI